MRYKCPVEGCDRIIKSRGAMKVHIQNLHNMLPGEAMELAKKAEIAPLEEKSVEASGQENAQVAELKEKLAAAEGKTMNDFDPDTKAKFVIDFMKGLSTEDKVVIGTAVGLPMQTEAFVAEETDKPGSPRALIKGKTDLPGYKYLDYLDLSVKQ